MAADAFVKLLNEQIAHEYAAHQQYVAIAVYYDSETLPQLARFFYRQALEERDHAMMMVQYLLDTDAHIAIPGVDAPESTFVDVVAPLELAVDQEKRVTEQINTLLRIAREENDFASEQFMQWFIKEQIEEVIIAARVKAGWIEEVQPEPEPSEAEGEAATPVEGDSPAGGPSQSAGH